MITRDASVLPLDNNQTHRLESAVADLDAAQLQWVSGYVAGLAAASEVRPDNVSLSSGDAESRAQLIVLFGSQTGHGEAVAEALARAAEVRGYTTKQISLADFRPVDLKRESLVSLIVSTHGDGDPPDDAELFYEYLMSEKAPLLPDLRYSLLALGDSSYANFCQTGRDIDTRLSALGATRFAPTTECDLDYDDAAMAWSAEIVALLPKLIRESPKIAHLHAVETASTYDRKNPFSAEVLTIQKITGSGSSKDVRHIELSLDGSAIRYEAGDALAVVAANPPALVGEFLELLGLKSSISVIVRDQAMSLGEALSTRLEITVATSAFLRAWADLCANKELRGLLAREDSEALAEFLQQHQIIDVVRLFPVDVSEQEFVDTLRSLSPRSYSIASGPGANPDQVHLTVAAVRYNAFGTEHWGAASTHLTDRLAEGEHVSVYVESNKRFRLPEPERPIIMIGPGTGIAPFRAFIEERIEQRATGDSWLIFGDRNADSDFLYQIEWHRHLKNADLTRMDVAFSRDQPEKIYVQNRIAEHAAELHRWIENGAAIYVCGDAKFMARDVHDALVNVFRTEAHLDVEGAELRLRELRRIGRYQRDVY